MAIKNLTFTTLPASNRNAADGRRAKTIERLEEQKLLVANPLHVRTTKRTVKIDGEKSLIEKQRRVYPWWRTLHAQGHQNHPCRYRYSNGDGSRRWRSRV